jgi:hypothetical protein
MPPTRCSGRWPQPGHNIALLGPSGEGVCAGRSGAPGPNQTKGTTPPERVRAGGSHVRPRDMSGSSTLSDGAEGATARTRNVPGQGLWMRASTRVAHGSGPVDVAILFAGAARTALVPGANLTLTRRRRDRRGGDPPSSCRSSHALRGMTHLT